MTDSVENKKLTPFDAINHINSTKTTPSPEVKAAFNSWVTETYFSNHHDTVFLAELASMMRVSEGAFEQFWRGVVQKGKRAHFWPKSEKDEKIELLAKHYEVSIEKATEMSGMIPNSIYLSIKKMYEKK